MDTQMKEWPYRYVVRDTISHKESMEQYFSISLQERLLCSDHFCTQYFSGKET